MIPKKRALLIL